MKFGVKENGSFGLLVRPTGNTIKSEYSRNV